MPEQLLPTVITFLRERIEEGFPVKSDQNGLLVVSFSFPLLFPFFFFSYIISEQYGSQVHPSLRHPCNIIYLYQQAASISCLTVALTTLPSSHQVKEMLCKELSTGEHYFFLAKLLRAAF